MNKQKWAILLAGLALIAVAALTLVRVRTNQKLGAPGVIASPISGSKRWNVYLPPRVLNYDSIAIPTDTNILNGLPQDTSFADRQYMAPDGQQLFCRIVMMGTDRTSIHKPEFCLTGSGWRINDNESASDMVRVERPYSYDLPVMKLVTAPNEFKDRVGNSRTVRVIFVYWFVADHELTEKHWVRMRNMSAHLLATGELERWAYVSCFAYCSPGDEARTYDRLKKFIAASVPEFQLATGPRATGSVSPQAALN